MKDYLQLFWAFIKVGALTFGGGYAMLPILQRDIVEKHGWVNDEEVMDYYAMAQCLPGIIMVNTSVFIGRHRKGTAGGIVAGLASALPSLVIITVIAMFLTAFAEYPIVQNAFAGIRACVVVLIVNAVVKLWKSAMVDWKSIVIIFLPVFALSAFTEASPILLVVAAAIAGIVITVLADSHKKGGEAA
ncbi:MAG TPA: chromate transporter [Candidatus Scatomorpha merdigallinarum]|nr:chromate transporter [Candidatus Scatomorpha merdigallinarum]